MKKLIFILLIAIGFSLDLNAQTPSGVSAPIVTYKIDTTGYSNGLTINQPFYIFVNSLTAEIDTAVGFMLLSYTKTTTDSLGINKVVNDSLPSFKIYPMSIPDVDTLTLDGMVEKYIKQNLIDVYNSTNVIELE